MKFTLITLFPEMFPASLGYSLAGTALKKGLWAFEAIDLKNFGQGKHNQVDDTPYGGGAGMVLKADVLGAAIESTTHKPQTTKLIYMSPRGKPLTQAMVREFSELADITIICGRFEGIDERVLEHYKIEEVSIGDYVLSGGEPAALVLMDAVIRVLPNVIGNAGTHDEESFSSGLLEYPHYTRPTEWNGRKVPEVLMGGNHGEIAKWRRKKALELTKSRRPDLLQD